MILYSFIWRYNAFGVNLKITANNIFFEYIEILQTTEKVYKFTLIGVLVFFWKTSSKHLHGVSLVCKWFLGKSIWFPGSLQNIRDTWETFK